MLFLEMRGRMLTRYFVDTHVHFWNLALMYYDWLTDKYIENDIIGDYHSISSRDYLPADFEREVPLVHRPLVVHLECALGHKDPVDETKWIASLAVKNDWIGALVGRGDLRDTRFEELLERHMSASNLFRGIRMFSGPDVWTTSGFKNGLRLLRDRKLILDLEADADTLPQAAEMAGVYDDLRIILEHAGFPKQRTVEYFHRWRKAIKCFAAHPNVACKISGLGMVDHGWSENSIRPWVEECFECFGAERCMFGSNWPVDSLYSSYAALVKACTNITKVLSEADQQKFFYQNAVDLLFNLQWSSRR